MYRDNIYGISFSIINDYYFDLKKELDGFSKILEKRSVLINFNIKNPSKKIIPLRVEQNQDNNDFFFVYNSKNKEISKEVESILLIDEQQFYETNATDDGIPYNQYPFAKNNFIVYGVINNAQINFINYSNKDIDYYIFNKQYNLSRYCYILNLIEQNTIAPISGKIKEINKEDGYLKIEDTKVIIKNKNNLVVSEGEYVEAGQLLTQTVFCNQKGIISLSKNVPINIFKPYFATIKKDK